MNGLALFAGVGGLEIGLEIAVPGYRTVCAVERDAYAASVLVARMADKTLEEFPIWDDITTFSGKPWRGKVDIVSGGFPCQDISCAGKQAGIKEGTRSGLWSEFARIIGEVRPRYAFIENVAALASGGLDRVLADLAALGFDAEWLTLAAGEVGAPHKRERVFILAFTASRGRGQQQTEQEGWEVSGGRGEELALPPVGGQRELREPSGGEGQPDGGHKIMALPASQRSGKTRELQRGRQEDGASGIGGVVSGGISSRRSSDQKDGPDAQGGQVASGNVGRILEEATSSGARRDVVAHSPLDHGRRGECGEEEGAWQDGCGGRGSPGGNAELADAKRDDNWRADGSLRRIGEQEEIRQDNGELPVFPPGPGDSAGWECILRDNPYLAPAVESGLRVLDHELALVVDEGRADQLRCAGNGVVALQAAVAFRVLAERINKRCRKSRLARGLG
jgi:site-specific DNA-cytosine methylase